MLKTSILIFLILFNACVFNQLIIINKLIKIPSHIFSAVFIILSLPTISVQVYWIIMVATLLLILIYHEIIEFNKPNNKKKRIFRSGLFLGIMTVIDVNFGLFYLAILFGLFYYNEFNWRHFIIQLIGVMFPFIFYYILTLLNYNPTSFMYTSQYSLDNASSIFTQYPILFSFIGILLILSKYELYNNYYKKTEHSKKGFVMSFIIATLIIGHIIFSNNLKLIYFLSIPITILIGNYLIYIKHAYFRTFLLGLLFMSFLFEFFYL